MPHRMEHLPRKAAQVTAKQAGRSGVSELLALAGEGRIALHAMPRGCRRFDLPKAGRSAVPMLVVIGGSRDPARPGDFPAAGAALRWARAAMIRTPDCSPSDYAEVREALMQHRTAVLIETSPVLLSVWQALAAAAQREQPAGALS
jgi:hypothetical protein